MWRRESAPLLICLLALAALWKTRWVPWPGGETPWADDTRDHRHPLFSRAPPGVCVKFVPWLAHYHGTQEIPFSALGFFSICREGPSQLKCNFWKLFQLCLTWRWDFHRPEARFSAIIDNKASACLQPPPGSFAALNRTMCTVNVPKQRRNELKGLLCIRVLFETLRCKV